MRFLLAIALSLPTFVSADNFLSHGYSLHGSLKYGPDFTHFDYTNPNAPKGGEIRLSSTGTFDSLNPFIMKGLKAPGIGLIYDTLMKSAADEVASEYGLLTQSIEVSNDQSWAIYTLNPQARWHDGEPITSEDVVFSFNVMMEEGHPYFRSYYASVEKVEQIDKYRVRFVFGEETNRELPFIVGQLTVLPKHYWKDREFGETSLELPLGSGPYRITAVEAGRFITYERVNDYWGKDLPVNKGRYNFDRINIDVYRDQTVTIEALKAGEFDYRSENISKEWATAYETKALKDGRMIKDTIPHEHPTGMQAFWFNTRRTKFADPAVRRALSYAFDFEWTNKNLFYDSYTRTQSYFSNSELASTSLPKGRELEILEPYRNRVPDEVFTTQYKVPKTDGTGNLRANLRTAKRMLEEAGWKVIDNVLRNEKTGEALKIEVLLAQASWERIVNPMISNMKILGIETAIRIVDSSQYQNRIQDYDYDMIVGTRGQSHSPGNEQRNYWTSASAEERGGSNLSGISDPVVDELVEKIITAPNRQELVAYTRALDRVLLWGHYVIPHWHTRSFRIIHWNKFGKPEKIAPYAGSYYFLPDTWWYDSEKAALLEREAP
tara:strand:+ start:1458 stop:3275 length:1818 start_codon:yes stop_codon:yes gene_type:complete